MSAPPAPQSAVSEASPGTQWRRGGSRSGHPPNLARLLCRNSDRHERTALAWTSLVLGAVGVGSGLALTREAPSGRFDENAFFVTGLGAVLAVSCPIALASTTKLEELAAYDRQGGGAARTAQVWVRAGRSEHSLRNGRSGTRDRRLRRAWRWRTERSSRLTLGGLPTRPTAASSPARPLGAGALYGLLAVTLLASDGPVESALHAYEASHGIPRGRLAVEDIAVAPTNGGAAATIRGTF